MYTINIIIMIFPSRRRLLFAISLSLTFFSFISCDDFPKNNNGVENPVSVAPPLQRTALIALEPPPVRKIVRDSSTRVIYMTFDDGPLSPTPFLNQIVSEKQIRIAAFVVGQHALTNPVFLRHLDDLKVNPLVEVVNHSYSHANGHYKAFYSAPQRAAQDMIDNESKLGLTKKIVRMPGRDIWALNNKSFGVRENGGSTATILRDSGYKIFGWDVEWEHYGKSAAPKKSPEAMVALIDTLFANGSMLTKNNLVFLGHDEMLYTEKARNDLRMIIDALKAKGYVFDFISNYPD